MKTFLVAVGFIVAIALSLYVMRFFSSNNQTDDILKKDYNIVLITIDTLRADHLSCYGYHRETSPFIDTIAEQGIRFTNSLATASWTSPSMASIMTSLYPITHGVNSGFEKSGKVYDQNTLNEKFHTLAEILRENGYTTFGAVANVHMAEESGFAQGFDYYYCEGFNKASQINDIVYSWKDKIKESEKYFLWLHYFDPHVPYSARLPWFKDYTSELQPENINLSNMSGDELKKHIPVLKEKKNMRDYLSALYDSEISYVDYHLGKIVNAIGLEKNSLIIITSDHGDELLDHGLLGHRHTLYQELINVPLIIKFPSFYNEYIPKNFDRQASIVDIMPTLLKVLGISSPAEIHGKNILMPDKGSNETQNDYHFSELIVTKAIQNKKWKYIYHFCTKKAQLYNIVNDPGELDNLAHKEPDIADKMQQKLFDWLKTTEKAPLSKKKIKLTSKIEGQLKALGYISVEKQEKLKPEKKSCTVEVCH